MSEDAGASLMPRLLWRAAGGVRGGSDFLGFLDGGGFAVVAPADELFVEGDTTLAEGALVRIVGREIAAHQAEDRTRVELDGGAAPEAADADDEPAQLLDQIDQEAQGRAGADQIFDQKD